MRKVYLIPNLITTGNLFCGFVSVLYSIEGKFGAAVWAIVLAGIFDLLDGRVARMARATSSFGIEYDSLSDLTSFGVAPAVLMYQSALVPFDRLGIAISFLFMMCGALRLARFNTNVAGAAKNAFQGLPIPVAALTLSTFFLFYRSSESISEESFRTLSLGLSIALALLMISSIPFPSFKELNWRSKASLGYLFVALGALALVITNPDTSIFLIGMSYITLGVLIGGFQSIFLTRKSTEEAPR